MAGLATVRETNGELILDWNGEVIPLRPLSADLFGGRGATVGFVPETARSTQYIMMNGHPCTRIQPRPPFAPDAAVLASFAGTYSGDAETVNIRANGGRLYLRAARRENQDMPCVVLDANRLATKIGVFELRRPSLEFRHFQRLP